MVHQGQHITPRVPAFGQAVQEQDHFAIGVAFIHVMPLDAVDRAVLVVELGIDGIVRVLEAGPKFGVFIRQVLRARRRVEPDKSLPRTIPIIFKNLCMSMPLPKYKIQCIIFFSFER